MSLEGLIYKRLVADVIITSQLAEWGDAPAVFMTEAPSDTSPGWNGEINFPRIVCSLDMTASTERKCQGTLTVYVDMKNDFDSNYSDLIAAVKNRLLNIMLTPEGESPYLFAWNRTEAYQLEGKDTGTSMLMFDVLEYPEQITGDPDPVAAMNGYLKKICPEAKILHYDRLPEIYELEGPVFYVRSESESVDESTSTYAVIWIEGNLSVHIFHPNQLIRNMTARMITEEAGIDDEIMMTDKSPMFIRSCTFNSISDWLRTGQLSIGVRFGRLRHKITEKKHKITDISILEE